MDAAALLRLTRRFGLLVAVALSAATTAPADVPGHVARSTDRDGSVSRVREADRGRRSSPRVHLGATNDALRDQQRALDAVHLSAAPGAPRGAGALVAVIDSGVDATHPDLAGRVVAGPDLVERDVAGLIAAAAGNAVGVVGVAPDARILAVRVLDETEHATPDNVAAGIDAAVNAHADVINLSINWTEPDEHIAVVTAAIQRAADSGVLVVVAAGNDAQEQCAEPVLPQRALCVGEMTYTRKLAPSSNHSAGLGIVAPGEDLISARNHGGYESMSGTSQAAAMTSGVAALFVGLGLHGDELMQRLIATARDISTDGPHPHPGAGALDAARAVDGASQHRMPALLHSSLSGHAHAAFVARHGLLVGCDAARPGLCHVSVRVGSTVVAHGDDVVDGSDVFSVVVRPTAAGRRLLTGNRTVTAVVQTTLGGAASVRRPLVLRAGSHAQGHPQRQ